MAKLLSVFRKELSSFFGSPVAYLFIGAFLAAMLFVFFWVEAFFARNIADVRPLFDWMPVLLIFLAAALTMRLWSEERRAGTLEVLATLPVPTWQLVMGKFLAAWALVAIALALTAPLPLTVALLGPLDWGPVIGGYLATLLLAAAYLAIGLFVSARTDNPIVALIVTTLLGALFWLIGSPGITALFGHGTGDLLRLLGSGARFESISRGVLDPRDLYFYISVIGVFLALTIDGLERLRWAASGVHQGAHRRWTLITLLAIANLLTANLMLYQAGAARLDLTAGRQYTISEATRTLLGQVQEPLLIRGYFSADTHPLLAPLVPQLRDLLREYQLAGGGRVQVEFVDPAQNPDLEREAGEQYGIRPTAFQTASKYQAGVVNSYFDVLIKYGDQFEHLGFRDLIEVKAAAETDIDVRLRNPEYDLTRGIRKVLYGYQGGGDPFAGMTEPVRLRAFLSAPGRLPTPLPQLRKDLEALASRLQDKSGGRFSFAVEDPDADPKIAAEINEQFGFQPMVVDLLDPTPFWFYLVLEQGEQRVPVPLPESLDAAGLERAVTAGLKRFAPGVLRTVALVTPPEQAPEMFGMPSGGGGGPGYTLLKDALREGYTLRETDLTTGQVPEDADLLLVVAPDALDDKQVFAIDQFMMQGGTVVLAAADLHVDLSGGQIAAEARPTGLEDWLGGFGVTLGPGLVLDPQNTPFPIPVQRNVGGFTVDEIQTLGYPYFPDIRGDGLAADQGITAGLGQITFSWASPIVINDAKNAGRTVTRLIESSEAAWTSTNTNMQPDLDAYGSLGFPRGEDRGRKLLGVVIEGPFQSAFTGKPSPVLAAKDAKPDEAEAEPEADLDGDGTPDPKPAEPNRVSAVVDHSPASARLILFGSATFLSDTAISLATEATQTRYLKPLDLIQNTLDWSLEDRGLLGLRGRGQFSRTLAPIGREQRMLLETLNYLLALGGLALVWWVHRQLRRRRERALTALLAGGR